MSNRRLDNGNTESWSDWRADVPNMNQADVPGGMHARHAAPARDAAQSAYPRWDSNLVDRPIEVGYSPDSGYFGASDRQPYSSSSDFASGFAPASTTGANAPHAGAHVSVIQDPDDPNSVIIRTRKKERKKSHKKN